MDFLTVSKDFLNKKIDNFTLDDVRKLSKIISYHSDLYYNREQPIISDKEYDELFKKLEILEKKFNIKNAQTNKVWAELKESSFKKVNHSRPMISLDNTYNEEDLKDFDERVKKNLSDETISNINYILELKFDWLGIELIYDNGEYKRAITRWNWIIWEDVTENIRQIKNIPKKISYKGKFEIRWEVIMPISVFNDLNKKARISGDKIFSNPRNASSWSVRTKNINLTKERKLEFFAYDLANFDEFCKIELVNKYSEVIWIFKKLWFTTSPYLKNCKNIEELIRFIDDFWDKKKDFDFEIDGLVIKVNNITLWDKIWWTQHHPRYAIAYKFPAEILTTKILSVDHQVWRTGTITPVANLVPINIGGVTIKRATLHNYEEVSELDIRIWDNVFIKRAWEVIPKIISVIKVEDRSNLEKIYPPEKCPSCEAYIKKDIWKVRYYCPNYSNCEAQIIERLSYSVWKEGFNIDWLWEKQIQRFFELWFIKDISDIFEIEKYKEDILKLDWFQQKSVDKIIKEIKKAKIVEISVLLNALSIPWIWKKTSKILASLFVDKNNLLNFNYNIEDIEKLEDIWPEIAKNILDFFTNSENKKLLIKLEKILDIKYFKEKEINKNSLFFWKKVCITWSFVWSNWEKISRDDLVKILEENWGKFVSSVSKNTDFLLAWEKAWSKLEKAKELEIKILDLTDFINSL